MLSIGRMLASPRTGEAELRPRDWIVVSLLLAAALWFGRADLRQTPLARFLAGECGDRMGSRFSSLDCPPRPTE
ncbi:MAG: hypothetical protein K2X11_04090 [Acetobacteraceae bacterium]|nr:hypothetical protein [Acetobacteraceae bacterium]